MNAELFELAKTLVTPSYIQQGAQARQARERLIRTLLANRKLPPTGWDDATIELFLQEIASMDTSNFIDNIGAGEREARVFSPLVARRHYRLGHGIGRSGDVAAMQPKAAGSSLLLRLTQLLVLDAIRVAGVADTKAVLVLPVATGMAHVMTFLTLRKRRPGAKYIVWPRMDQKTCLKAIFTAGFEPIVIDNVRDGDEVRTDVDGVRAAVERVGADNVLCVLSTSSCFMPRTPDKVDEIARVCAATDVPHVVNNAYGVQCKESCRLVARAMRVGRVDAFIQSTDKNFLVPVGGSVVASADEKLIDDVSKTYPGRASMAPVMDLFITLLSMGNDGWSALLRRREETMTYMTDTVGPINLLSVLSIVSITCSRFCQSFQSLLLGSVNHLTCLAFAIKHLLFLSFLRSFLTLPYQVRALAEKHGERLLATPHNPISLGMTIDSFSTPRRPHSFVGAMLFTRCVSGPRVVSNVGDTSKDVCGVRFDKYGAHCDDYAHTYLALACAIGMTKEEVDELVARVDKALCDFKKEAAKQAKKDAKKLATATATSTSTEAGDKAAAAVSLAGDKAVV
jgi:O-phospho-L-seryl-tRNASec:L-selenocysteinyl-tRNA synthase